MHTLVKKTDNTILYQLIPGKPDPKEMAQETGEMRGRVVQKNKNGPCCWYYGLNFLRKRIGPTHAPGLKNARDIEKTISLARKKLESHHRDLPTIYTYLESDAVKDMFKQITPDVAKHHQAQWDNSSIKEFDDNMKRGMTNYKSYASKFQSFAQDPENSENFLKYLQKDRMKLCLFYKDTLIALGIDPQEIYIKNLSCFFDSQSLEGLPQDKKLHALQYIFITSIAEKYNLKLSTWKPHHGIDALKKSLEEHGPHYIGGALGINQYQDKPYRLKTQIENCSIWGWKSGTAKNDTQKFGHSILVVGIQKTKTSAFVYFVDPKDDSDPSDLEKQKIYVMSYSTFTERLCNLFGMVDFGALDPFCYAIHA